MLKDSSMHHQRDNKLIDSCTGKPGATAARLSFLSLLDGLLLPPGA